MSIRVGFTDCDEWDCRECQDPDTHLFKPHSDSRSCSCLGESGGLQRVWSYFPWCFRAVGLYIGSLSELAVHPSGSDDCLIAWAGQTVITGLTGSAPFPA